MEGAQRMNAFATPPHEKKLPWRQLVYGLAAAALLGAAAPATAQCAGGGTPTLPSPAVDHLRAYRASFRSPTHLAVDDLGRVYVADPARGAVVVRAADGRVVATGEGLGRPVSVAADAGGDRIWVGDGADGRVTAYSADWWRLFDLGQGRGELGLPADLALDPATGNVWVADSAAHEVKVYGPSGARLARFGGRGTGAGQFHSPAGIFVDAGAGEVLVADQLNSRIQIFDLDGNFKSCVGVKVGNGKDLFVMPQGIWADAAGRIYVSDAFEGWVRVVDRQGATLATFGGVGDTGVGPGELTTPTDLVIDPFGRLFVASSTTARLETFGLDAYGDPELFVPAEVVLGPEPLKPAPGATVAAAIEVPGYRLELVEPASIAANGVPAVAGSVAIGDADGDHEPDLGALFDGPALAATLPPEGGTVRLSGALGRLELEGLAHLAVVPVDDGDSDGDGIPDAADGCPGTAAAAPTDDGGCSLAQLCPCSGPAPGQEWKNHGQYVSCVARRVGDITRPPLDQQARQQAMTEAAQSRCGNQGGQP